MSLLEEMLVDGRAELVVRRMPEGGGVLLVTANAFPDREFDFHWNDTPKFPSGDGPVAHIQKGFMMAADRRSESLGLLWSNSCLVGLSFDFETVIKRAEELGVRFIRKEEIAA